MRSRWIIPATGLLGAALWPVVAFAQDPASAISDLAKTPISIFGAWGLSLSILIGWLVSEIRQKGKAFELVGTMQTALAQKDATIIAMQDKWLQAADARTMTIATTMAAGNAINDKVADDLQELKRAQDNLKSTVEARLPYPARGT